MVVFINFFFKFVKADKSLTCSSPRHDAKRVLVTFELTLYDIVCVAFFFFGLISTFIAALFLYADSFAFSYCTVLYFILFILLSSVYFWELCSNMFNTCSFNTIN